MRAFLRVLTCLCLALPLLAQSKVGVEIADVSDNRISHELMRGALELRIKLTGDDLERAMASRIVIKEAVDDLGTQLMQESRVPDFSPAEYNAMGLQVSVAPPPRKAKSVRLKGTVELYVPSRDPNAIVKIDKPLASLDKPLKSPKLKTAKLSITPMSREGYAKAQEARKITPEKIEKMKAEARTQGVSEQEIELMAGLAEAFSGLDEPLGEGAVALTGRKQDFERIFRVDLLAVDGEPVTMTSRGSSTREDDITIMTLQPSDALPPNAPMRITLLTDKSRMSFPFELTVDLP